MGEEEVFLSRQKLKGEIIMFRMFCCTSSLFLYSQDACSKIRTFQLFWVDGGNQASYWGRKKAATRKVRLLFSLIKEKKIQSYWYGHTHLHGNLTSNSYPSWILLRGILVSWKRCQFIFRRQLMSFPSLVILSVALTLYTRTSVCIFSILFSLHFPRCW